jgi:hypothetical protein
VQYFKLAPFLTPLSDDSRASGGPQASRMVIQYSLSAWQDAKQPTLRESQVKRELGGWTMIVAERQRTRGTAANTANDRPVDREAPHDCFRVIGQRDQLSGVDSSVNAVCSCVRPPPSLRTTNGTPRTGSSRSHLSAFPHGDHQLLHSCPHGREQTFVHWNQLPQAGGEE